jgi:CRP-like cAMP-binding protein
MHFPFEDQEATLRAAAARVQRQRALVEMLAQRGLPTAMGAAVLATMEDVLTTMQRAEAVRPAVMLRNFSQNRLIARLAPDDLESVTASATLVEFAPGEVLLSPSRPMEVAYFIESGVVAAVGGAGSRPVEVATIGREGMVGAELVLGGRAALDYVAVFGGQALQVDAAALRPAIASPALADTLSRFTEVLRIQSASAAIAGAAFTIDQRLARALLMYQDRADGDELAVTHTTLANLMAVRRAGVTDALHRLEGDRLVLAHRSSLVIRNRAGLEKRAAESYGMAEATYRSLFPAASHPPN